MQWLGHQACRIDEGAGPVAAGGWEAGAGSVPIPLPITMCPLSARKDGLGGPCTVLAPPLVAGKAGKGSVWSHKVRG